MLSANEPVSNASRFFSFSIPFKYWTIFDLLASDDSVGCKYFTIFFARGLTFSLSSRLRGASLAGAISLFRTLAQTIWLRGRCQRTRFKVQPASSGWAFSSALLISSVVAIIIIIIIIRKKKKKKMMMMIIIIYNKYSIIMMRI